ncbi:hypothetical protein HK405_007414 [Cladochytrium tenue]|nr:hypothetical protein HK405_007414 [Cladochytrium tenue]
MRFGVLDVTTGGLYVQAAQSTSDYSISTSASGAFNVSVDGAFFASADTSNPLAGLRFGASVPGVTFDVTFGFSPVLLYGGVGEFAGTSGTTVHEWASPAGNTTGHLVVNGTRVDIQSAGSTTWFDCQWDGAYATWHWYEINLDVDGLGTIKIGVWDGYDAGTATWRKFASIREQLGILTVEAVPNVTAVTAAHGGRTFTSVSTNITYDLDYVLSFKDQSTKLVVSSIVADQEIAGTPSLPAAYEGFISITGTYKGKRATGYGIIEITTVS